jgi:hypothetical protein
VGGRGRRARTTWRARPTRRVDAAVGFDERTVLLETLHELFGAAEFGVGVVSKAAEVGFEAEATPPRGGLEQALRPSAPRASLPRPSASR